MIVKPNQTNRVLLLAIIFFLVQMLFLSLYGIRSSWDTEEYKTNAFLLLGGKAFDASYIGYSTYISYLALHLFLVEDLSTAALGQIVLAAGSVFAFYKISLRFLSPHFSFGAAITFAIWPALRYWDAYLYTESLYTSLLVISLYCVLFLKESKSSLFWMVPLLGITAFIRPSAWLFLLSLFLAAWTKQKTKRPFRFFQGLAYGVFFIISVCILLFLFYPYAQTLLASYSKGEVIYPNVCIDITYSRKTAEIGWLGLLKFVSQNPLWFLKLAFIKIAYFLSGTKPYYSLVHNALAVLSNGVLYTFAIWAFCKAHLKPQHKVFSIVFLGSNILMVGITAENWDGRFLLPLLPLFILLCYLGLEKWVSTTNNGEQGGTYSQ